MQFWNAILHAIIYTVNLGIPKWCIVRCSLTCHIIRVVVVLEAWWPKKTDYYSRLGIPMSYLRAGVKSLRYCEFTAGFLLRKTIIVSWFMKWIFEIIKILFGLLKVFESSNQDENNDRVSVLSVHISELCSLWTLGVNYLC